MLAFDSMIPSGTAETDGETGDCGPDHPLDSFPMTFSPIYLQVLGLEPASETLPRCVRRAEYFGILGFSEPLRYPVSVRGGLSSNAIENIHSKSHQPK